MSGGILVFAPLQFVLVVVVRQSIADFEDGKGGIKRPTNTLSKSGSDAARLTILLLTNDLVERLHPVVALVALSRVATVARHPCLGTGAVSRGAETGDRAEAA